MMLFQRGRARESNRKHVSVPSISLEAEPGQTGATGHSHAGYSTGAGKRAECFGILWSCEARRNKCRGAWRSVISELARTEISNLGHSKTKSPLARVRLFPTRVMCSTQSSLYKATCR